MAHYEARGQGGDSYNRLPRRGYEDSYAPNDEGLPQALPTSAHLVCRQCVQDPGQCGCLKRKDEVEVEVDPP